MNKINIRYISDLHIEICPFILPYEEDEHESILILAGDICMATQFNEYVKLFFKDVSYRFKKIIYVLGNHEHYTGSLGQSANIIKDHLKNYPNIHVLDTESVVVDDIVFIGATLWTDMNGNNPLDKISVASSLNDYHVINNDKGVSCTPDDTIKIHNIDKEFIKSEIVKYRNEGYEHIVVISHHAPSLLSIHPKWAGNKINAGFSSDLFDVVHDYSPSIWFHGHMHDNFDYMIGSTRVLCNPRGYSKIISIGHWAELMKLISVRKHSEINPLDYHNTFVQENVKFNPWAYVEL